jgi:hypothetical protein
MCPACMASAVLMAAGVVSTGGLTALAAKVLGSKDRVGRLWSEKPKRKGK